MLKRVSKMRINTINMFHFKKIPLDCVRFHNTTCPYIFVHCISVYHTSDIDNFTLKVRFSSIEAFKNSYFIRVCRL